VVAGKAVVGMGVDAKSGEAWGVRRVCNFLRGKIENGKLP
jgi:hypothetical protein